MLVPPRRRYELVVDELLEIIRSRGLRPGQALPTERELAGTFGVSRNVLREAFGVLEHRGLIRSVRGSGRYLREVEEEPGARDSLEVASIADVLEARTLLEVHVADLACQRRTADEARRITDAAGRLASWDDNLAFHALIAAAAHNFVLERLVREQAELAGALHQRERYEDPDELATMRREHQEIAAAVAARDGGCARELVRRHLDRTRRVVLASLR